MVTIVGDAASGDETAWTRLIRRFDRTLRTIARSYRLPPADVDDVVQATWLRLYEHIDRIREPAAVASWLATTCRRECARVLQVAVRERLTDDPLLGERVGDDDPEARVLAAERWSTLHRALGALPERHRRLMALLLVEPPLEYRQISDILAMPVGSIGPIRARCITRLAHDEPLRALHDNRFTAALYHGKGRARSTSIDPSTTDTSKEVNTMSNHQSHMLDLSIEELESMDSPLWGEIAGAFVAGVSIGVKVGLIVAAT